MARDQRIERCHLVDGARRRPRLKEVGQQYREDKVLALLVNCRDLGGSRLLFSPCILAVPSRRRVARRITQAMHRIIDVPFCEHWIVVCRVCQGGNGATAVELVDRLLPPRRCRIDGHRGGQLRPVQIAAALGLLSGGGSRWPSRHHALWSVQRRRHRSSFCLGCFTRSLTKAIDACMPGHYPVEVIHATQTSPASRQMPC